MREFIRHPSDIPIEFSFSGSPGNSDDSLQNISEGGLSFKTSRNIPIGSEIVVSIPISKPPFEEKAIVCWSAANGNESVIGVRFVDPASEFRLRMIEQVCHIEHYKNEVKSHEGRNLSGAEAADEWIKKYAANFPR